LKRLLSLSPLTWGLKIKTYHWGKTGAKVYLAMDGILKTLDFRKMIEFLLEEGYQVEGIDMKGHGLSDGKHTALPEFRDNFKKLLREKWTIRNSHWLFFGRNRRWFNVK